VWFIPHTALSVQVNLRGKSRLAIMDRLEKNITRAMFQQAEDEILNLMASDSFTRFKQSPAFAACLAEANSPHAAVLRKLFVL
jgi:hypothetical protein